MATRKGLYHDEEIVEAAFCSLIDDIKGGFKHGEIVLTQNGVVFLEDRFFRKRRRRHHAYEYRDIVKVRIERDHWAGAHLCIDYVSLTGTIMTGRYQVVRSKAAVIERALQIAMESIRQPSQISQVNEPTVIRETGVKEVEIEPVQEEIVTEPPPKTGTVQALRGGEIVGGSIEYKVKVKNDTLYVINNVTVTVVAYPEDCMNIDGDSIKRLSRIEPGGFRSPLFKFAPTKDCVEGQVLASVSYVDHENKIKTVDVAPFVIRSVCDLLTPLQSSMEDFEAILANMQCTSEEHQIEWNPEVLFEKAKVLLPSKNFYIVDERFDTMAGEFIGTIRGFAEGKYTQNRVAVRIRISGLIESNQSRVVIEGLGDDDAMLPTTIVELTRGIESWTCMHCGAAFLPGEVSQIKVGAPVRCRYCEHTMTIDLYRR